MPILRVQEGEFEEISLVIRNIINRTRSPLTTSYPAE